MAETVMLGRVVDGDTGLTVGYVMPVGGGQFEAVLLVGVHEHQGDAYRRVCQFATLMKAAREEAEND